MCLVIVKQEEPSDWEGSWKMSGIPPETKDIEEPTASAKTIVMTRISNVFMPGWSDSWLLSAAPPEEEEERRKNWSSCWGFRQQTRWVVSMASTLWKVTCSSKLLTHTRRSLH